MAAKKRGRIFTFMSEMPWPTQENNENQEVDNIVSVPLEQNQEAHLAPTQVGGSSLELSRNNTIDEKLYM